jgi:hypothetical protein
VILLISASWVARIIGMSHRNLQEIFLNLFSTLVLTCAYNLLLLRNTDSLLWPRSKWRQIKRQALHSPLCIYVL